MRPLKSLKKLKSENWLKHKGPYFKSKGKIITNLAIGFHTAGYIHLWTTIILITIGNLKISRLI